MDPWRAYAAIHLKAALAKPHWHYLGTLLGSASLRWAPQWGQQARTRQSRSTSMRRTAGRVGCGGGPARAGPLFSPPAGLPKPQVLQEGEGDHHHQGMVVQPGPGAALEVVEAEFLLHLLVRLLADPAGLDRRRQARRSGRVGRQVGEVVLPLAAAAPLAHQPDLVPGQVRRLRSCAPSARRTRRAAKLAASGPLVPCRHWIGRHGARSARLRPPPAASFGTRCRRGRPCPAGPRPAQLHRGGVDLLRLRDAHRPERGRARPGRGGRRHRGRSRVGQGTTEADAGGAGAGRSPPRAIAPLLRKARRVPPARPPWRSDPGPGTSSSGRKSRSATGTGTSPRARVSETRAWQFAVLPSTPQYCRATPTECSPFLGSAVSSMISTALRPADEGGPPRAASTARSGAVCQAGLLMKWCSWSCPPARAGPPSAARSCARPDPAGPARTPAPSAAASCGRGPPGTAPAKCPGPPRSRMIRVPPRHTSWAVATREEMVPLITP